MKKLKKFKRYAEGGALGTGEGDPFSYTDFSDRARNLKKPSEAAEIDDSRERYASTSASGMMNPSLRPGQGRRREDGDGEPAKAPPPSGRREIPPTPLTKEEERADSDKGAESSSVTIAGDAKKAEKYRQSLMSGNKPPVKRQKPVTVSKTKETTSVTAAPAKSKVPAKIDSDKLLKDAEEEVLRKKPTAMTEQMRKAPTIRELYKGQKSMSDEIGDALKSFRETIRGGLQKGKERQESKGSTMYAKGGKIPAFKKGGLVSRGDGCAQRGKTKGRMM